MDSGTAFPPFAQLLRGHRLAAGLTQEALAERARLSWRTISDLERGINHRPQKATLAQVAEALALPPAARAALEAAARSSGDPRPGEHLGALPAAAPTSVTGARAMARCTSDSVPRAAAQASRPAGPPGQPTPRGNLPAPLTSFIGRAHEQREVTALLRNARLVTLTGTGGAGKTRLALQVAAELAAGYGDGAWLVDLAPLVDPALVAPAVAAVLGLGEAPDRHLPERLVESLCPRQVLLVLDNCEHLIAACATLAELLLRGCPGLRILATSRDVLGIAGEVVWRVPPLSVPDGQHLPPWGPDALAFVQAYEAVALFVARAGEAEQSFTLTCLNAPIVVQICVRLDGIPLAVELAAARVKVLSVDQIARRLEDRFRLLAGGSRTALPRQQTLRATMDWSYALLAEPEQTLLRGLSVFAGSFDLEAAEAICGGGALGGRDVVDLLTQVVDKSLVLAELADARIMRYRLLETVRQYAGEKLRACPEEVAARDRHLHLFLTLAEHAYAGRIDAPAEWLERLELEHDNLRAALHWARARHPERHLELAGSLAWFWQLHTHYTEGRSHLAGALAARRGRDRALARALWGAGLLASWQGHPAAGRAAADESLALWRELGDQLEVALALEALGWARFFDGDDPSARQHFMETLAIRQALGDPRLVNRARLAVCQVLVSQADIETAGRWAQEALSIAREHGDGVSLHQAFHLLADCALMGGDMLRAERLYAESLRAAQQYGDRFECSVEVQGIAMAVAGQGRPSKAQRLGGAAAACREDLGIAIGVRFWDALLARFLGHARALLNPEAAAQAWEEGKRMGSTANGFERAVVYALDLTSD